MSQSFRLKPKHLITLTLGICLIAVIALIVGIFNTFKPRSEARTAQEPTRSPEPNRVEVWKPEGSTRQGTIVLNPESGQSRPATRPAAAPANSERTESAEPAPSCTQPRPQPRRPVENSDNDTAYEPPARTAPAREPKPEPRAERPVPPKPQADSKPAAAPQPKQAAQPKPQQHKEVIDNLF
ncbi:hypothetical protein [Neisseria animalis]|uniref:Uncharacterized protein n=1 Tax=Neisseria animalis TaxID=492 RepID=A0A5P3MSX2_NEIAN|nr:hypothetical protein [Neisseria animalis]QEY23739.1 hypothetical protein D0T90_03815 [Neisseria animalis]ROW32881.1 hypothetical protein CGZ60_03430 [Neisseria animalis]VEE09593.1 Periplasmic protein [Neisseria animalis]